jgi:hypothetical protein
VVPVFDQRSPPVALTRLNLCLGVLFYITRKRAADIIAFFKLSLIVAADKSLVEPRIDHLPAGVFLSLRHDCSSSLLRLEFALSFYVDMTLANHVASSFLARITASILCTVSAVFAHSLLLVHSTLAAFFALSVRPVLL